MSTHSAFLTPVARRASIRSAVPRLAISCLALMAPDLLYAGSFEGASHYSGIAYAADGGPIRYREEHWLFREQGTLTRLVLYRCPNGQPFARKWLHYSGQPWAPDFTFEDARDGYLEGATRMPGAWRVYVRDRADATTRSAALPSRPDTVVDAGFDAFVQSRWATLNRPEGVQAAFVVPGRLGYLDLKLKPLASSRSESRQFRLGLDGFLGAIAPSLRLTYASADRRLEEFVGISNIRDEQGHRQRVQIRFPLDAVEPAPTRAEVESAARLPLTSRCSP
ncbi:hypothetical protein [Dyella japonica]|uniref:Secreted protein n=1 Tax=Dyella japonica TaxID=231455 RepID=A0ABV2JP85_9GAMM